MQNLMAALALGLAGLIIWRSWWTIVVRHSPAMAARVRGKRGDDPVEAPAITAPTPWFVAPSNPVLELKAARIRSEPAATPEPALQIARRGGWSADDDVELLRLLAEEMPAEEIAAKLGRSEKSVQLRIPLLRLRQRQAEQAPSTTQAG
jgi:hypothetical protein